MTPAQTKLRQLRERQSKERGRVAELAIAEELTDETRAELDTIETGTPDLERQIRAATVAVEAEESEQRDAAATGNKEGLDTEDRERLELRSKVRMGRYVQAAMENRAVDGAESELNAAVGIGANRFPLELLAPPERRVTAGPEDRAVTAVDTQTMPRTWLDRLFVETAAMRLGITMESVPAGSASFPVTTAGASAAQRGKDQAAADTAWTVGVVEMKPKRNAATLKFSIEDTARIPGLESALTRDLRMALTEGVDRAIFLGDSGATPNAGDIVGLQTAAIDETTLTQTNKIKGPETLSAFLALIDGIHATTLGDLNVVSAVGAYRLWETTVINSTSTVTTLAKFLRDAALSWAARGSIEDATANGDFAAFVGRRMGIDGAGVAALWSAGELIRDVYSGAAKGSVNLTLTWLWDFGLPRPENFQRLKFVT